MGKYTIACIRGDGIGPEILEIGVNILRQAAAQVNGLQLKFTRVDAGATVFQKSGKALPDETFSICKNADAIYKAPVGMPGVTKNDGTEAGADVIVGLRSLLDLYVNLRPIELYEGVPSPLARKKAGSIKYTIVRENTECLYVLQGGIHRDDVATNLRILTRKGCERIMHYAFDYAGNHGCAPEDRKKRVTCVDSSKVLVSDTFFRKIFDEIGRQYPQIEKDYSYTDAFAQAQLLKPEFYHVIVTPNFHGDIISDLGGATVGSIGLAAGANIGDNHAMFEPIHGSAPTLTGKNIANPTAMIIAGEMMLRWLGDRYGDQAAVEAAEKIRRATVSFLARKRQFTLDLGGKAKSREMGEAITEALSNDS